VNTIEQEVNAKISGYFKDRYPSWSTPEDKDWIHDRSSSMELIQELVYETGGIHLDYPAPGSFRCMTDKKHIGFAGGWGRCIANTFCEFIDSWVASKKIHA
jgi:hypothetical protein